MERRVELMDGVEGLYLKSISRSDSKQRAGRAGRTKPGVYIDFCPEFEDRLEYPRAEIERVRLDQTVLRLAEINFDLEKLVCFHQPDRGEIVRAKDQLQKLGCMTPSGNVTAIGRKVSKMPVSVMFGRMIVEADRYNVVKDVITIASILEVGQLNARKDKHGNENIEWRYHIQRERQSDVIAQLNLFKAAELMDKPKMADSGIHIGAFFRAKQTFRNIERAVKHLVADVESEGSREDILKAVCSGIVNHVYKREYSKFTTVGDSFMDGRELGRESVVDSFSSLVVGLPFDLEVPNRRTGGKTKLKLIRMASTINYDLLMDVAPQLFRSDVDSLGTYSDVEDAVMSMKRSFFNGLLIKEEYVKSEDQSQLVELKIEYLLNNAHRPYMSPLRFSEDTPLVRIPDLLEHQVGQHPVTNEPLYIYGTYRFEKFVPLGEPIWLSDKAKAEAARNDLIQVVTRYYNLPLMRTDSRIEIQANESGTESMQDKLAKLVAKHAR